MDMNGAGLNSGFSTGHGFCWLGRAMSKTGPNLGFSHLLTRRSYPSDCKPKRSAGATTNNEFLVDAISEILNSACMSMAAKLEFWLKANGKKKSDFAKELGIANSVLSRILNNNQYPNLKLAFKIERATGNAVLAVDWFAEAEAAATA